MPGTATVTVAEPFRSGTHILVDVSDEAGQVVARGEEVNGEAPPVLGARFPVGYLRQTVRGRPVYAAGNDPFMVNLLVFFPFLLVWLVSLPFVGACVVRLISRLSRGLRPVPTGSYRAGHGDTRE